MRVAVISDTHDVLRDEVLEQVRIADAVIHAGDFTKPKIIEKIKANLQKDAALYLVRGNGDGEWVMNIPETLELELEQTQIFVVHNRKKAEIPQNCDIVIFGHTHKYLAETADGHFWLNPGACGRKRFRLELSMAVLNLYSPQSAASAAGEKRWQVEKITIEPDKQSSEKSVTIREKNPLDLSSGELLHLINGILTRMRRGKTISQIAAELDLENSFVEEICRIYVTHPGVTANGILDKLEVNRHVGA